MISKETIDLLEKYDINYSNMDEDTIAEVIEALKELEAYSEA